MTDLQVELDRTRSERDAARTDRDYWRGYGLAARRLLDAGDREAMDPFLVAIWQHSAARWEAEAHRLGTRLALADRALRHPSHRKAYLSLPPLEHQETP